MLKRDLYGGFGSTVWLDWLTQMRMHTSVNPVLALFRSTSPRRHWVVSLPAILDAAALRLSMGSPETLADDINLIAEGSVTLGHLNQHHRTAWKLEKSYFTLWL